MRELIGKVNLTSGDVLEVRMPTVGDVLTGVYQHRNPLDAMIEAATGMTIAEFNELPAPDGFAVLTKLNNAIQSMNTYLNTATPEKKM